MGNFLYLGEMVEGEGEMVEGDGRECVKESV